MKKIGMKKRILAFVLCLAMVMNTNMSSLANETDADEKHNKTTLDGNGVDGDESQSDAINTNKTVTGTNLTDLMINLEVFSEGNVQTVSQTKSADIVLVLDQSASMYAPMGCTGSQNDKAQFVPPANAVGYDHTELLTNTELQKKAGQLGYFVVQSTTTTSNDWFVVHREDDGDGNYNNDNWTFYRIDDTSTPTTNTGHDNNPTGKLEDILQNASFHTKFYLSQSGALYDAVTEFVNNCAESNRDNRIAIVGFSGRGPYVLDDETGWPAESLAGSGVYVDENFHLYSEYESQEIGNGPANDYYDDALVGERTDRL